MIMKDVTVLAWVWKGLGAKKARLSFRKHSRSLPSMCPKNDMTSFPIRMSGLT